MCEELAKGNTVSLGSLGYLKMTMNSKGAVTGEDYKVGSCLKGVNCRFITSKYLKLTSAASFTKGRAKVAAAKEEEEEEGGEDLTA